MSGGNGKMKKKNSFLKYTAIGLAVIFLVAAGLFLIGYLEKRPPDVPDDAGVEVFVYDGREYVRKKGIESLMVISLEAGDEGDVLDSLMLIVFDNYSEEYSVVRVDRDTVVPVSHTAEGDAAEPSEGRIASAYGDIETDNGRVRCRNVRNSLEALLDGVKISHYLSIKTGAIPELNDLVGGVGIEVTDDLTFLDGAFTKGAVITLTGEQALKYVSRTGAEQDSESARAERQRLYINALCKKALASLEDGAKPDRALAESVALNMLYDSTEQRLRRYAEKADEYRFLGIREIACAASPEGLLPEESSVMEILSELFWVPKE